MLCFFLWLRGVRENAHDLSICLFVQFVLSLKFPIVCCHNVRGFSFSDVGSTLTWRVLLCSVHILPAEYGGGDCWLCNGRQCWRRSIQGVGAGLHMAVAPPQMIRFAYPGCLRMLCRDYSR